MRQSIRTVSALSLVTVLLSAHAALAAKPEHVPIVPPPAKFARGPFLVKPVYHIEADVNATCQAMRAQPIAYSACSVPKTGDVYLPKDDGSDWWQELRAHELAHLRGWGQDHRK